jgi:hypothetical protein
MVPLTSELKRTAGVFAETAWAGAAYYLMLYMLASHVSGFFFCCVFLPCLVLFELYKVALVMLLFLLSSSMARQLCH